MADLTLTEKASLLSGLNFWHTQPISRNGEIIVPAIMLTDGPHGLRKQATAADHLGINESVPATCFPPAVTLASTWDPDLLRRVGVALGVEARANDVAVLLGPGINIKRSPLCGRNFEYFSEDPFLTGRLAAPLVAGIQSQGVGTSLKHFAVNNQETDRMRISAAVDERTLREIYLPAFEYVIKQTQPWTVMCAYNKINGVYAAQNHWLLTSVLRDEWGFTGLVVSDWGAVRDRVASVLAGLDLQMPGDKGVSDAAIVAAVQDGRLSLAEVDTCVRRVLELVARAQEVDAHHDDAHRSLANNAEANPAHANYADAHHALAREAAAAGTVLLANEAVADAPLLPLAHGTKLAVIGELARTPRYQGAGSSQVNPTRLDDALTALRGWARADLPFAAGYTLASADTGDGPEDAQLRAEAVELARTADTVLVFLGLPAADESEGFDREQLDLPEKQIALLHAIAAVNKRIVVVLANGSTVAISPWRHLAPAIVEGWLGGQAGGSGIVDVLTGAVNPAGRLAETIPVRLADNPSFGNFPGEFGQVRYGEGILVGYRWYDTKGLDVAFPFGHGLSYTTFSYSDLTATATGAGVNAGIRVSVRVTNTGSRAGAEVVQLYVHDAEASVQRPPQELKGFAKVFLAPGASEVVEFDLAARALAFWHPLLHRWVVETGTFSVSVGASARDLRGTVTVHIIGEPLTLPLHAMSTFGEALAHPVAGAILQPGLLPLVPRPHWSSFCRTFRWAPWLLWGWAVWMRMGYASW